MKATVGPNTAPLACGHTLASAGQPTRALGRAGVLLVGPMSNGPLVGGIETGIDMILRSDLVRDHRLTFFNSFNPPSGDAGFPRRLARQLRSFTFFCAALARRRPAVVHVKTAEAVNFVQGMAYALLARAAGCRVVMQIHGGSFDTWYERLPPAQQRWVRTALRTPHALIALSEFWRRYLATLCPHRPVYVVPNGVELHKAPVRAEPRSSRFRVVTIGAIGVRKGHFDIVEAARLLKDMELDFEFVGPDEYGGETDRIRARARELGIHERIILSGPLSGDDKWNALASADVFLLPAYNENMPNAVLEAMAAALPVIATDVGAVHEMLGDASQLVPTGDPAAIAAKLRTFHADMGQRLATGRANYERVVAQYSFEQVEERLGAIYVGRDPAS